MWYISLFAGVSGLSLIIIFFVIQFIKLSEIRTKICEMKKSIYKLSISYPYDVSIGMERHNIRYDVPDNENIYADC